MLIPVDIAAEQQRLKDKTASPLNADFEKLVHETLDLWHVPGVAIGIVDGDFEWSKVRLENLRIQELSFLAQ